MSDTKAIALKPFLGAPDGCVYPDDFQKGDPVAGELADVAIGQKWAREAKDNIGPAAFARSSVVKRLNAGDYAGAAEAFLMWNRPAALIPRRQAERDQFVTPYATALPRARRGEGAPVKGSPAVAPKAPVVAQKPPAVAPSIPPAPAPAAGGLIGGLLARLRAGFPVKG